MAVSLPNLMPFVRWTIPERPQLVASRCTACDRLVACSSDPQHLAIAEQAHAQSAHPEAPASSLEISMADALFFRFIEPIFRTR